MAMTHKNAKKHRRIRELYYITHIDNIPSILKKGILSHERIEKEKVQYTPIYDKEIISRRQNIVVPDGRRLWSFANLFFNARNPMLYRVTREKSVSEIAVLGIRIDVIDRGDVFLTTGNAACEESEIMSSVNAKKIFKEIIKEVSKDWWGIADGSKRKIMAECLVPDAVPSDKIASIYVPNHAALEKVYGLIAPTPHSFLSIIVEPFMFFEPNERVCLPKHLKIVEGDMFFSRLQTLTISVNTVGIMGKGVASRAKYQFPDVYVRYQDLCRNRTLQMGKPYLYKRESSLGYELADEPLTLSNTDSQTWFLLFPTKRDWRDQADINGIESGLQWLCDTYKKSGIESLAIPALGCGLGRLDWRNVGPLLCKYLSTLDIPVELYLPAERKISKELLSRDFLLSKC